MWPRGLARAVCSNEPQEKRLRSKAEPEMKETYCAVTVSLNVAGVLIPLTVALMKTVCAVEGVV